MLGLKISGTTKFKGLEIVTPLTDGSVPFGSGGKLGQDNANLFWDNTNNRLGIGTTSPAQLLHVSGATNPTIQVTDTTNTLNLRMQAQDTRGFIGTSSNHEIRLITNNSAKITIQTGGNVGIGTVIPQAKLEVGGTPGTSVGGFPSGNLHVTGQSALINANAVITGHNLFGGNKQLWYLGSVSGSNDSIAFINRQNAALSLSTNSTERMKIESDGSVKINESVVLGSGSADASAKLDLVSTIKGFLLPRMTTTQRDAITSPATGLTIYNTTTNVLNFFNGTVWGAV